MWSYFNLQQENKSVQYKLNYAQVSSTCGIDHSRLLSDKGSSLNTSKIAADSHFLSRASIKSASAIILPLPTLMKTVPLSKYFQK